MNLPDVITIKVICKKEISNIITCLKVKAGNKNPYHICFPKSDGNGIARLLKSEFVGQFADHLEQGLMDYNGTIETADPEVEVYLFDPTLMLKNRDLYLAWPLFKHEKLRWKSREELYDYMTSCSNKNYKGEIKVINLELLNNIIYKIQERLLND